MKDIERKVGDLVEEIIHPLSLCLVRVEYVQEEGEWFLRVFITKEEGIQIEDCVLVSKALSRRLDEEDFIKTQYHLEVSSPGIDNSQEDEGGKIG